MSQNGDMARSATERMPPAVYAVAGAVAVALLVVSARYGFHRDELYFVAAGRRLAWGYVDQPPLVPFLAGFVDALPGAVSPTLLRVVPALSAGFVVVLTADMARTFGGARRALAIAAALAAVGGFFLGVGHLLSTSTFDVAIWALIIALVARILAGGSDKLWLGVGAAAGLGMLNKFTVAFLIIGLIVSLLLTPQRRTLASVWVAAGAVVGGVIALPTVLWQAANGWPQLEMGAAISGRDGPVDYVLLQVAILSVFLVVPAVRGGWWLWSDPVGRLWRVFPIAFVLLWVVFLLTGGKGYYAAPLYLPLLAAGGLWLDSLTGAAKRSVVGLIAFGAAIGFFLALPLLPPDAASVPNEVNGELGETYGWPELVDQVEGVVAALDESDRANATIFTSNYGQAGAIEVIGEARLPQPVSGHNNYWLWGPGTTKGPIVGVGYVDAHLRQICPTVELVATLSNPAGLENDEFGTSLWLCRDPSRSLADIWNDVRHFD